MLNPQQQDLIYRHAYVPEHLPDYVQAVSGAEPALQEGYLCYLLGDHLIFVGYPLGGQAGEIDHAYELACKRFRPSTVAIIAPTLPFCAANREEFTEDWYYQLALPPAGLPSAVAYMIRRASRELRVDEGAFSGEHERLIGEFLSARNLGPSYEEIFRQVPKYLEQSRTALLLEARKDDNLAAFSIADLGSADYGFYMFNFRSLTEGVPGASDLVLYEMMRLAHLQGKRAINLGLGIHPGVTRFKEKWGAEPFLRYRTALIRRRPRSLLSLLTGL
jgi:hypothetical protein